MGDLFDYYEGSEATSRSSTTHRNLGRQPQQGSGTGMPDDRTPGSASTLPTSQAYSSWRQYVRDNHRLEQIWDDETRGEWTTLTHKRFYTDADRREFENLQRNIRQYQQDQHSCDLGSASACGAIGRRDQHDRAIYNSHPEEAGAVIRQETGSNRADAQHYWENRNSNNYTSSLDPSAPTLDPPGDIMGGGTSTTPASAPEDPNAPRRARCSASGGRWSDDAGGACFHDAPVVPAPHTDDPADRTGEQVPSDSHTGHDDQRHRSAESGGGMHDGSAGSGSNTGSGEVEHFDTGGKPMSNLARQANPVKKMLNLIGALQDPYGEFKKCNTEKKYVE